MLRLKTNHFVPRYLNIKDPDPLDKKLFFPSCLVFVYFYILILCVESNCFAWSHTMHTYAQQESSGQRFGPSQRPLHDSTQYSQQTNIHVPSTIQMCGHSLSSYTARPLESAWVFLTQTNLIFAFAVILSSLSSIHFDFKLPVIKDIWHVPFYQIYNTNILKLEGKWPVSFPILIHNDSCTAMGKQNYTFIIPAIIKIQICTGTFPFILTVS